MARYRFTSTLTVESRNAILTLLLLCLAYLTILLLSRDFFDVTISIGMNKLYAWWQASRRLITAAALLGALSCYEINIICLEEIRVILNFWYRHIIKYGRHVYNMFQFNEIVAFLWI